MIKNLNYNVALLFILIGSSFFGLGYIVSVVGFEQGLKPLEIIAGRMLIASVLINIVFFKQVRSIVKKELFAGIALGCALFGVFAFQTIGLQYTTASISAFISSIYVVFIPFLHWKYYKTPPDKYTCFAALLTIIGVGFISLNDGLYISIGIVLTLICTIFATLQIFATEIFCKRFDPVKLTIIMLNTCFVLSVTFLAATYSFYQHPAPTLNLYTISVLLFLGIFTTIIPFLLQNIGQKHVSATKASLIMSTEAIFATLFSIVIFNEVLNLKIVIGCILITLAIIIAETKLKFN